MAVFFLSAAKIRESEDNFGVNYALVIFNMLAVL